MKNYRLAFDFFACFLFYILSSYLGWLNFYSSVINHDSFHYIYNIYILLFFILRIFFKNNEKFYIFIFPNILYFFVYLGVAILIHQHTLNYFVIFPMLISYFLLGFWVLPFFLWLSCVLNQQLTNCK